MYALTIHQPWASLLAYGIKIHETRSWRPPVEPRERFATPAAIAFHAGKGGQEEGRALYSYLFDLAQEHEGVLRGQLLREFLRRYPTYDLLPRGAVVGAGYLDAVVPGPEVAAREDEDVGVELELELGYFDEADRIAWRFRDPHVLATPLPARGYQSLWWWRQDNGRPANLGALLRPAPTLRELQAARAVDLPTTSAGGAP